MNQEFADWLRENIDEHIVELLFDHDDRLQIIEEAHVPREDDEQVGEHLSDLDDRLRKLEESPSSGWADHEDRIRKLEASATRWPTSLNDFSSLQRKSIWSGLAVVILMALVPPWDYTSSRASTPLASQPAGYWPLVYPPRQTATSFGNGVSVAWGRLFLQVCVAAALTFAAVYAIKPKET